MEPDELMARRRAAGEVEAAEAEEEEPGRRRKKVGKEKKKQRSRWKEMEEEAELVADLFGGQPAGRTQKRARHAKLDAGEDADDHDDDDEEDEARVRPVAGEDGIFESLVDVMDSETRRLRSRKARSDGDGGELVVGGRRGAVPDAQPGGADALDMFVVEDRAGNADILRRMGEASDDEDARAGEHTRRAAWVDEEEEELEVDIADGAGRLRKLRKGLEERVVSGVEYERRLRAQHMSMFPRTGWADVADDDDDDDDEGAENDGDGAGAIVPTAGPGAAVRPAQGRGGETDAEFLSRQHFESGAAALASSGRRLPPGLISVTRLRDANAAEPSSAVVQSIGFHPRVHGLMFTAGFDRKLRYFQVDGRRNPLVQGVHFADMPIHSASYVDDGRSVLCAGRRRFLYLHHLEASRVERITGIAGRDEKSFESFAANADGGGAQPLVAFLGAAGCVPLFSLRSRQAAGTLRMSGTVRCASFCNGGTHLMTAGGDGAICLWDLRMRRCLDRKRDEGTLKCTALDFGSGADGDFYACGSDTGGVNVYQAPRAAGARAAPALLAKKPRKQLMNLTTTVDNLRFSHDCQMLAMTSRMKKESMRLVHLPSCTVFSNWPTLNTPLHYVHSVAFSANDELVAVGNAKGKVLLYRLLHYSTESAAVNVDL